MASPTYARVRNDLAVEIFIPPDDTPIEACFHPLVVLEFEVVPDGTEQNATRADGVWTNPPPLVEEGE